MKQPAKVKFSDPKKKKSPYKGKKHKKYGTSKLERDFASEFLDKMGLLYIYQFFAESIGRYYDFAVLYDDGSDLVREKKDGIESIKQKGQSYRIEALIEVDGDWYHSNKILVNPSDMNPMQKHNKRIDEYKNIYAASNGIVLLRFWENDIRNNPSKVISELKKNLSISKEKIILKENKKKKIRINEDKTVSAATGK